MSHYGSDSYIWSPSDRRAFFVVGPESSGTRMLTRAFMSIGFFGDDGHDQAFDSLDFKNCEHNWIVFRRSVPHNGEWPHLDALRQAMVIGGYNVTPVAIFRDPEVTARSQVKANHCNAIEQARLNVLSARNLIFAYLGIHNLIMVDYEQFGHDKYRAHIFEQMGLPCPSGHFSNSNEKYLKKDI